MILGTFGEFSNSVLNKGKSTIHTLFNSSYVLSFATDKTKLFAENVSKNSSLDDPVSLYLFTLLELI